MNNYLAFTLTVVALGFINHILMRCLESRVKLHKNIKLQNKIFDYATWAKGIEVGGLSIFILLSFALLFFSRDLYDYIVFSLIGFVSFIILIYRINSWKKEKLYLLGNKVIYTRGRFKKKVTTIYLNDILDVEIKALHFFLYMKDGRSISIPISFKESSLIYSILKHHRPEKE